MTPARQANNNTCRKCTIHGTVADKTLKKKKFFFLQFCLEFHAQWMY